MQQHVIGRVFAKRETEKSAWSGRIGSVELVANIDSVTVNGKPIGTASIDYLLNFSLQSLQDAYAGADSIDEATGSFEKKLAALIDGTIGVRGSGGGMSDEERAEIYVAEQAVRAKLTADEWKKLDDDAKVARVESAVETLREKRGDWFAEKVAERVAHIVEQRKRRAAEKAEMAGLGDVEL